MSSVQRIASKRLSLFLLIFCALGLQSGAASSEVPSCPAAVARTFENKNASIRATEYQQNTMRGLENVESVLGEDFKNTYGALPPGAKILDSGGGLSVYGLSLSAMGHRVICVNTQDFYEDMIYPMEDLNRARHFVESYDMPYRFYDLPKTLSYGLAKLAGALGIEVPTFLLPRDNFRAYVRQEVIESDAHRLVEMVRKIHQKVLKMERSGKFLRVQGYVQDVIAHMPSSSEDEIIDSFGAAFYSTDRLSIFRHYYRVLKSGRKAHVSIGSHVAVEGIKQRIEDRVVIGEQEVPLGEYLAQTYPNIFRLVRGERYESLTIQKSDAAFPDLETLLGKPQVVWLTDRSGMIWPKLTFHPH